MKPECSVLEYVKTTDSDGFHRQLPITFDDMRELVRQWIDEVI